MIILLPLALVLAGLMVWGLLSSRKQRGVDHRHFAAFVGFTAAVVAVTATTFELVVTDLYPHSMSRAWGEFLFATCIIITFSIPITFLAGLVSRGTQRIALVSGGIVVALMCISGLVSHFRVLGVRPYCSFFGENDVRNRGTALDSPTPIIVASGEHR